MAVFADGVDRVRPTVFLGKGLRISTKEKQSYDRRDKAMYQEKAWCNQEIMKEWISTAWVNSFKNPKNSNSLCSSCATNQQRERAFKETQNVPSQCVSMMYISCASCRSVD